MKKRVKNVIGLLTFISLMSVFASGCIEHRYYREHHDHSPSWYNRHHRESRVDIDIHN